MLNCNLGALGVPGSDTTNHLPQNNFNVILYLTNRKLDFLILLLKIARLVRCAWLFQNDLTNRSYELLLNSFEWFLFNFPIKAAFVV